MGNIESTALVIICVLVCALRSSIKSFHQKWHTCALQASVLCIDRTQNSNKLNRKNNKKLLYSLQMIHHGTSRAVMQMCGRLMVACITKKLVLFLLAIFFGEVFVCSHCAMRLTGVVQCASLRTYLVANRTEKKTFLYADAVRSRAVRIAGTDCIRNKVYI